MRRWSFVWVVTLAGCHLALGLDEIDPGTVDGTGASSNGGAGSGGGGTSPTGGSAGASGSTGIGGATTSSTTSVDPSFLGPAPGKYLLAGYFAGGPGPRAYVVVTKSGPVEVALTIQFVGHQTGDLVGSAAPYTDAPDVLVDTTHVALGTLVIPGAANPISTLPIIAENVELRFESNSPPCGTFAGAVTSPISQSLDGSTFSMTPVSGPDNLPGTPALACP